MEALTKSEPDEISILFHAALKQQKLDVDRGVKISLDYTRASTGMVYIRGIGKLASLGREIDAVLGRLRAFTGAACRSYFIIRSLDSDSVAAIDGIPSGRKIAQSPDTGSLVTLIRRWMEECRTAHDVCNPLRGDHGHHPEPELPTRVLDVTEAQSSGTVRLWETNKARHHYIALSHRWGGSTPIKTLQDNYNQRLDGFSFSQLPQTFQDACTVACKLGIRYVWIDSLCIIQDSTEDWRREAARMGDVYKNATLTFAATAAQNSDAGFLRSRHLAGHAQIPVNSHQDGMTGDLVYLDLGTYRNLRDDVDNRELNHRGWVLQERVLAPRTLHFSHTQVYWECWTHQLREDGQQPRRQKPKSQTFPTLLSPSSTSKSTLSETPKQWFQLLEAYTASELTFQSDKLVAIGGLVQRLGSQTGQKFIRGLWGDSFYEGLLWVRSTPQSLERIPEAEAPSWSWASWNGAVGHVTLNTKYANYKGVRYEDDDGGLRLRGNIYALDPSRSIVVERSTIRPPELLRCSSMVDEVKIDGAYEGWTVLDQGEDFNMNETFWVICALFENLSANGQSALEHDLEKKQRRICLLVRKVGVKAYERVGVGHIHGHNRLLLRHEDAVIK
ncbi:HET-domain-containing protein [Trematosphaeria pertusa]|uniref:HET-domain-containing protein n=1 Tax=Trematosphaeria pertusa TaxID=390896 RepID=A0A6A6IKE9_9PLEO|nr:HET-domain-containing protein [Trematosphaeria pertusa]KAF2251085.1 HET-domain-containing protein [Trematosphaeria pertusa]